MIVTPLFATRVTGVMNFKPIMKSGCVIDVIRFIVELVMKWISVRIVQKLCVGIVLLL